MHPFLPLRVFLNPTTEKLRVDGQPTTLVGALTELREEVQQLKKRLAAFAGLCFASGVSV